MISGKTIVAGVAGRPVGHSLSPVIHNAWLRAAGVDGVYVAFQPTEDRAEAFFESLRGGAVRGLNVTLPYKEAAFACADEVSERADRAGAANVLVFDQDGRIVADNTDGVGLLLALATSPGFSVAAAPVAVVGAGGAAAGAVAALVAAGAPEVRVVNRTLHKAETLAGTAPGRARAFALADAAEAFRGAGAVVNATSAGLSGDPGLDVPFAATPDACVVMDMVYKPLDTAFLKAARAVGRPTVDGLEMLIRQAGPSFEAFFGAPPPADVDVRALALEALGREIASA
jgi:shikimate dehydrogenase